MKDDMRRLGLRIRGIKAYRDVLELEPSDEITFLSDEDLEGIVGGVLSAKDMAYCKMSVEFYKSRGYTLDAMKKEMLDYQASLMAKGDTALASLSAEYLAYMISIW